MLRKPTFNFLLLEDMDSSSSWRLRLTTSGDTDGEEAGGVGRGVEVPLGRIDLNGAEATDSLI